MEQDIDLQIAETGAAAWKDPEMDLRDTTAEAQIPEDPHVPQVCLHQGSASNYTFFWTRRLVLSFIFVMMVGKTIEQAHLLKALAKKKLGCFPTDADVDNAGTKEDKEEVQNIRKRARNSTEFVHNMLCNRVVWRNMVAVSHLCRQAEDVLSANGVGNRSVLESALCWSTRVCDRGLAHIQETLDDPDDAELLTKMGLHSEGWSEAWLNLDETVRRCKQRMTRRPSWAHLAWRWLRAG